jgi:hypothetical protein
VPCNNRSDADEVDTMEGKNHVRSSADVAIIMIHTCPKLECHNSGEQSALFTDQWDVEQKLLVYRNILRARGSTEPSVSLT